MTSKKIQKIFYTSYLGYLISSDGHVYREARQHQRLEGKATRPYLYCRLHGKERSLHSIILAAFLGPKPKGHVIHHIDFNTLNNDLKNLQYLLACVHARGEKNGRAILTDNLVRKIRSLHKKNLGYRRIGSLLKLNIYTVRSVIKNENWVHVK